MLKLKLNHIANHRHHVTMGSPKEMLQGINSVRYQYTSYQYRVARDKATHDPDITYILDLHLHFKYVRSLTSSRL